jgi:hypothetical protein
MNKFVLFIPQGGLNDILCNMKICIDYCNKYSRILLFYKSPYYNINFSDYLEIPFTNIIYDSNFICKLLSENKKTIYPTCLSDNLLTILNNLSPDYDTNSIHYSKGGIYKYKGVILDKPNKLLDEDIIVTSSCGGGNGYLSLFKDLIFKPILKEYCNEQLKKIKEKTYLCIQVRNTDLKCDYKKLYLDNKDLIAKYPVVYLCTDNKEVLNFFRQKIPNILNFNEFPNKIGVPLHMSDIEPDLKFKNLIGDIIIATNSSKILSISKGGFINLLRECHKKKFTRD